MLKSESEDVQVAEDEHEKAVGHLGSIAESLGAHVSSVTLRCHAVGHNEPKSLEEIQSKPQEVEEGRIRISCLTTRVTAGMTQESGPRRGEGPCSH